MTETNDFVLRICSLLFFAGCHLVRPQQTRVHTESINEYCQWEDFNASCPDPNDVILMRTARYGRMHFGRCMREDHGSVGCSADVLLHLDRKCSGRRSCQVTIPDATLHNIHPCPKELMPYLEASYSCVTVKAWTNQICHRSNELVSNSEQTTETIESGILLSSTFTDLQTHSRNAGACPWVVRTKPGRRINLTLYSFPSATDGVAAADAQSACAMKVLILDGNRTTTAELCVDGQRQKQIYTSQGNLVRVFVQAGKLREGKETTLPPGRFLLNFQAFDCADISGLSNAWIRRSGDNVIVKCNFTAETFFLTCRNSQWKGELFNCSDGRMAGYHASVLYTYGILAVIGLGVSLGVATGVVLLFSFIVCLRKRNRRNKNGAPSPGIRATSHPLLSGPSSEPVEVQSIYLSDCRPYHQTDHICPLDICPHKVNSSWDPSSTRDPSSTHFHNAALFASIPTAPSNRPASASPASIWRSPGRNELTEFTVHGSMATAAAAAATDRTMTSSFLALLSETPSRRARLRPSTGSAEARFSDPGLPPYSELNCGTESGTLDLLNDFSIERETTRGVQSHQQLTRHPSSSSAHHQRPPVRQTYECHSEDCKCGQRTQFRFGSFSGGQLTRDALTTSTADVKAFPVT